MSNVNVDIVTPGGIQYQGLVVGLTVPGTAGKFQIFYNHASLLANLAAGELKIIHEDRTQVLKIGEGLLEVIKNQVTVMVESAEWME
jgi:F-type H+-transporting ATPase subunit epsilon